MIVNSDNLLLPEADETIYIRQLPLKAVNELMLAELRKYLKKKKCAYYVYLAKIETLNNQQEVYEKAHYCLIIKGNKKFGYNTDAQNLFNLMEPYLTAENVEKFVDISIIGWSNTIQFDFIKEDCIEVYKDY